MVQDNFQRGFQGPSLHFAQLAQVPLGEGFLFHSLGIYQRGADNYSPTLLNSYWNLLRMDM